MLSQVITHSKASSVVFDNLLTGAMPIFDIEFIKEDLPEFETPKIRALQDLAFYGVSLY